ncbi:hypothetical protein AAFF_G00063840 [Aldrovandia affinis]|uniref:Uncharacterized protein n=1 Tax=Aldrovandia affinis TaxID=143900 RepID=A0AAD7WXZ6_9TELE|nr:hypothetical protein AAFF_G00063840 [Aldrovandia affinis]
MQTVGPIHTLEQCLNRMQTVGPIHTLEQCLNRMQTVGPIHTLEQCLNRMQTNLITSNDNNRSRRSVISGTWGRRANSSRRPGSSGHRRRVESETRLLPTLRSQAEKAFEGKPKLQNKSARLRHAALQKEAAFPAAPS